MSTTPVIRVVVADDHELLQAAIVRLVDDTDVTVVAAAGYRTTIPDRAIETRPDILLLDLAIPGTDGLQLLGELRPRLPDTRIVILTASRSDADMLAALARGADGFLTKDASPDAIRRSLRAVMRGELALSRQRAATAIRHFTTRARKDEQTAPVGLPITQREADVLRLFAEGLTAREIAEAHTFAVRTCPGTGPASPRCTTPGGRGRYLLPRRPWAAPCDRRATPDGDAARCLRSLPP
ncbi:MAG: response regulator [Chloroflexota bacterium]